MGEVSAMYLGTMASYEVVTRLEEDEGPKGDEELRVHASTCPKRARCSTRSRRVRPASLSLSDTCTL
jgi:hypothetical protein